MGSARPFLAAVRVSGGLAALITLLGVSSPLAGQASGRAAASTPLAQTRGNPDGEWRYWGGDAWSTRFSPLEQINARNFDSLRVAWVWRGDNFGPEVDPILRSTPI